MEENNTFLGYLASMRIEKEDKFDISIMPIRFVVKRVTYFSERSRVNSTRL